MMNVDVTTGVMFKGGSLIDTCMLILGISNIRDLQGKQNRDILRRFLKNLTFKMIRPVRGGKEKVYKITDIVGPASEIRFLNQEGEEITVVVWAGFYTDRFTHILTNTYRTTLSILVDLFNFQPSFVSKLARPNSSSQWNSANSSLANSLRSQPQMVI